MAVDLFNELLNTVLDREERGDGIAGSHLICEPALGYLHNMADLSTVSRCLDKLREERKALREKK